MKLENIKTIVAFLFTVTGAAGLIYQIVWFKYLSLFLGNTTYAQMIVLATFLGGLAIGNYFIGRKANSFRNPLRFYAALELIIGVYCMVYPALSGLLGDLFLSAASSTDLHHVSALFTFLRFALSGALLLIPTIAMGGTLPILSEFFIKEVKDTRRELSILYFLNSFGAVIGVILAGFFMIRSLGLNLTIYFTASINLAIGILVITLSYIEVFQYEDNKPVVESIPESRTSDTKIQGANIFVLIITAGLSGLAALIYEIVWVRMFIIIFGSSTYAFSIMLAAFISGITFGSFLASKNFIAKFDRINVIAFCQGGIGVSTMFSLLFYQYLPYYLWRISSLLQKTEETFILFLIIEFAISFLMLIIPTLLMGITLPVIVDVVSNTNKKIGFSVGTVFSVNTLGTVIGVLLTGLVFIPIVEIRGAFIIGIIINILSSALVSVSSPSLIKNKKIKFALIPGALFLFYLIISPSWNANVMMSGVFRNFQYKPPVSFSEFKKAVSQQKILYYKEGVNANVAVTQAAVGSHQKRLIINGKPDASSIGDMPTQVLLGQIPTMLHSDPQNVFVIGLGSGVTIGSVLTHDVNQVDCSEISSEVIEAAVNFSDVNNNCLEDSRLKIFAEDADTYLKLTNKKYDVIISEPSNPWIAGIGNLYSKEYFQICKDRLTPDGIMMQWFHLYEMNDEVLKLVLNTFNSVFENATIWNGAVTDLLLVGFKGEPDIDVLSMSKKLNNKKVARDLKKIGIDNIFTFLSAQSISPKGFFTLSEKAPLNSEYHPLLEFLAPEAFFISKGTEMIYKVDEKFNPIDKGLFVSKYFNELDPTLDNFKNAVYYHTKNTKNYRFIYALTRYAKDHFQRDYFIDFHYAEAYQALSINNAEEKLYTDLVRFYPDSLKPITKLYNAKLNQELNATSFLKLYSVEKIAEKFIETTKQDDISLAKVYLQLAQIFLDNGEFSNAYDLCVKIDNFIQKDSLLINSISIDQFYYIYASSSLRKGEDQNVFKNYLNLMNTNILYPKMPLLRKNTSWYLREQEQIIRKDSLSKLNAVH